MTTKLDHALALAARGFRIFPLNGKFPDTDDWTATATADADKLRWWWTDPVMGVPVDRNVGVMTGGGFLVLDVDNKHQVRGDDTLRLLEAGCGDLPNTYTVRTPSGGRHLYFRTPHEVANSQGKLGNGLDIRGFHGYVVGPGSSIDDTEYTDAPTTTGTLEVAPQWLLDLCERPVERGEATAPVVAPDQPGAIAAAKQYLEQAPPAVQGAGGDAHTFKVAASVRDYGVSETTALALMDEHWNERCSPPWDRDELERKVANAYQYARDPQGAKFFDPVPIADFSDSHQQLAGTSASIAPKPLAPFDIRTLPRRRWVLGSMVMRDNITAVIAPGGVGKSTLTILTALSIASGKNLMQMPVHERTAVWLYNNEDPEDELKRRVAAAMQHHGLTWGDLTFNGRPMLYLNSGEDHPFHSLMRTGQGDLLPLRPSADMQIVVDRIKAEGIGVLVLDPFAETHSADENSNEEINMVARFYRDQIARATGCAGVLVHHTRKPPAGQTDGHAGNMDSARGASSLGAVARVMVTFYGMSERDAKMYGIANDDRGMYVRLDDAKANLSAPTLGKPRWFKRISVRLPSWDVLPNDQPITGDDGKPVAFEDVGTLAPVDLKLVAVPDELDEAGVAAAMNSVFLPTEQWLTRTDIASRLTGTPMFDGLTAEALRRKLRDYLEKPAEVNGWRLTARKHGNEVRIFREAMTAEAAMLD